MKKRFLLVGIVGLAAFVACAPGLRSQGLKGLSAPVSVSRDASGVPHIRASNDLDALYALGFVHAQDRLWQMELNRRTGAGRLSEILGEASLEQDKFLRTWGFYRAAKSAYPALQDQTKRTLDAYAAGVNAFIEQGSLPIEFRLLGVKPEPWQPLDSLVWAKMLAFDLSNNWEEELENAVILGKVGAAGLEAMRPGYPKSLPTIVRLQDYKGDINLEASPQRNATIQASSALLETMKRVQVIANDVREKLGRGFEDGLGSNNWVLSGSRTASGKPLLANDPHLRLQAPSLWYLADVKGDQLSAIGATLPGLPAVVIGRNERIGWGVTNTGPDTQDLFLLEVKDGAYTTPNGPVKLETVEEIIKVKDKETKLTVRISPYGPVISDLGSVKKANPTLGAEQALALRWVTLEPGDTSLDAFLGINYARNWTEFTKALERFVTPQQNFVYADLDGNIGYYAPGKIPVRNWDGRLIASAAQGQNWSGFVAFNDLPHVFNPVEGFIVTANNRTLPLVATATEFSTYTEGYRAARIRELILENPKHTVDTMRAAQADTQSLIARALRPGLLGLTPKSSAAAKLQNAVRQWWDMRADLSSIGATAFAFYHRELTKVFEDETGFANWNKSNALIAMFANPNTTHPFCDNSKTAAVETCADTMQNALETGAAALEAKLGPDDWRWERLHTAQFNAVIGSAPLIGPFLNRTIATPGSFNTVNVGTYNFDTFNHRAGSSYREILDFSDLNKSRFVHPLGQSGDPFNPNYDNLLRPWRDVKDIPMSQDSSHWGAVDLLELKP